MNKEQENKTNEGWLSNASLGLGIISVFIWEFSIVPILAIVLGAIGLVREKKRWMAGIGVVLGIVFLVVRISQGHINGIFSNTYSPRNDISQTSAVPLSQTPQVLISNPDYLKNPSAYLVDESNAFFASPKEYSLWVEGVMDSHTLKVSYVINKAGTNILEVRTISIPWLQDPSEDRLINRDLPPFMFKSLPKAQCWESGAKEYLEKNLLHTRVTLINGGSYHSFDGTSDGFRLFVEDKTSSMPVIDIMPTVIKNGYGSVAHPPTSYFLKRMKEQENKGISIFDADTSPGYFSELTDMEKVASLAKRGLWGTCPI